VHRQIDSEHVLLDKLRGEIAAAGTQKGWADRAGVSPQIVNDVLRGRRPIGDRMARALGYSRVVLFERLPKPTPAPEPVALIEAPSVSFLLIEELLERPEYEIA